MCGFLGHVEAEMANTPGKADFSSVKAGSDSSAAKPATADFGNVQGGSASTAPVAPRTYTVQRGDSLSKIAQHAYGHANRWREIFDANRDQLDDPDLIQPGQVLKLPDFHA
jgi:nucleoid-associated protein YgaU